MNLLDDTTIQPSKFRTRNCVEINDEPKGKYDNSNIRFKTSMIRSNLYDYSDAYILAKGTTTVPNTAAARAAVNNANKEAPLENCAPFTNSITEIDNTQVGDAEDIDIVMPMYNLTEYSDAYLKTSGCLWQYYRDEPAIDANGNIIDFPTNNNNSTPFKFKQKITGKTGNSGTKDVELMVPLKYLSNFWRTFEMPLINCEIILQFKWTEDCILVAGTVTNQVADFKITDTKLYIPDVTLSTQDNIKQLKQLESGFKRTINWNKYLPKETPEAQNRYSNILIDPNFQGINRLLVFCSNYGNKRL